MTTPVTRHPGLVRFGVFCSLAIVLCIGLGYWWVNRSSYIQPVASFDGESTGLQELVVVPTLDTPVPEGKSIVWCSSFQLAWNQLKHDLVGEPIRIRGAEDAAERLNRAQQSLEDISPESVFIATGFVRDGVTDTIRSEMRRRRPGAPPPELEDRGDAFIAFAHLAASVKYVHPFLVKPEPLQFTDARGRKTGVAAFGIPGAGQHVPEGVREQVRIEYASYLQGEPQEFALDLSKYSQPNQIVIARMQPAATLAGTLTDLQEKISKYQDANTSNKLSNAYELGGNEWLTVPTMHWRIRHRFRELEGPDRVFLNDCCRHLFMLAAYQDLEFCIDANGARVESTARAAPAACASVRPPTDFRFDQPYLMYLKKRDAKHPFFVMWVNDAELMMAK